MSLIKKKVLFISLGVIAIIATLLFTGARYAYNKTNYEYEILFESYLKITEYHGRGGNIVIPQFIRGNTKPVVAIGPNVFTNREDLTGVSIPEDVYISSSAFKNCTNLTNVTMRGRGTDHIAIDAFENTPWYDNVSKSAPDGFIIINRLLVEYKGNESSVVIPNGVHRINELAFKGNTNLTSLTLSDDVRSIGSGAFKDCTNLTSVTIPYHFDAIGDSAFSGCTSLTSLAIPSSVTYIGDRAFENTGLMSVIIPCVRYIQEGVFADCTELTSVTIPYGITGIRANAFSGCTSLTSITIYDGVLNSDWGSIDNGAFAGCISLTSVKIPDSITFVDTNAFYDTPWSKTDEHRELMERAGR